MYSLKGKTLIYKRWETLDTLQMNFRDYPDFIVYKNLQPIFENNKYIFEYEDESGKKGKLMLFDNEYRGIQKNRYFIGEFWVYFLKSK